MKQSFTNRHVIDFIFPFSLLFVFIASSLIVLVTAADFYAKTTDSIQANDESRSPLAYITTKIRQNDSGGSIEIRQIEDRQCLVLTDEINDYTVSTYIYEYDRHLKEMFIVEGVDFALADGTDIMDLPSLQMKDLGRQRFQFITVDQNGTRHSAVIAGRSESSP